ncbi:HypC/HybG/HupF family hydrogenase formation chaperone [Halioxenophilus aromaticivorans]|uniref:HypC/HybG/HupF family hydrogenase formation chaperone n=1 Tax=Halioxenophilus aromaticivorans TaxID=1306992 RepID=A0AAV3UA54_9ALTE
MCLGIPMQVIASHPHHAICRQADGSCVQIDTQLVGPQPEGAWLMTFLNSAREVISAERAKEVQNALQALHNAMAGQSVDHLFADLIDREPQLPDFLWPQQPDANEH